MVSPIACHAGHPWTSLEKIPMSNPNEWNRKIIEEFRANAGVVGGPFENITLLLLHTIGARSGQERINPVATMADGDRYVIIASKGGARAHPDWYHNLVANPTVTVEVGEEIFQAHAEVAEEPQRSALYARMAAMYPAFAEYERRTDRVIPVICLTPRS
jgi:deazaflavin-dependent oxidoreductase (nitroreductase family)